MVAGRPPARLLGGAVAAGRHLPLRPIAGHAHRAHRGHRQPAQARPADHARARAGRAEPHRHGNLRQDRHPHRRPPDAQAGATPARSRRGSLPGPRRRPREPFRTPHRPRLRPCAGGRRQRRKPSGTGSRRPGGRPPPAHRPGRLRQQPGRQRHARDARRLRTVAAARRRAGTAGLVRSRRPPAQRRPALLAACKARGWRTSCYPATPRRWSPASLPNWASTKPAAA